MGRIDCRTPARRRGERVMWVMLYALIIGCGVLLGYLGFGAPEQSLAGEGFDTRSVEHHAPTLNATPRTDRSAPAPATQDATPAPDTDRTPESDEPAAFFGIPVE